MSQKAKRITLVLIIMEYMVGAADFGVIFTMMIMFKKHSLTLS